MKKLLISIKRQNTRRKTILISIFVFVTLFLFSMRMILGVSAYPFTSTGSENLNDDNNTSESTDETSETTEDKTEGETEPESGEEPDEDEDGVEDALEDVNKRKIKVENDSKEVIIESELEEGEQKDKIKIKFQTSDIPVFDLEYESKSGSGEVELQFSIQFHSLIEFEDNNGDGTFNTPGDQIINSSLFESMTFLPIQSSTVTSGNSTLYIFNVTTVDGLFSLQFYVSNEFTKVNEALITPTQIKIDISIKSFPFSSSSSALALQTKLEAESEYEVDDTTEDEEEGRNSDEKEVEVTLGGFTGFFSWVETALVDGVNKTVKTTQDPSNQWLYLVYPQGNRILHDPKIGVEGIISPIIEEIISNVIALLEMPPSGYFLSMIMVTIVVVSGSVLSRIKKPSEDDLIENEL